MKNNVIINGISFSPATARLIECDGMSPADDMKALMRGELSKASLLALCLTGGHEESESWHEYVSAVAIAAGVT